MPANGVEILTGASIGLASSHPFLMFMKNVRSHTQLSVAVNLNRRFPLTDWSETDLELTVSTCRMTAPHNRQTKEWHAK